MSNYKNIKPYADFAHKAAQNGGIEKYLEMLENTNREIGAMEERKTEGWKAVLVLSVGIILWEGGKAGIRGIKKIYIEHKTTKIPALKRKSEEAKAAIIKEVHMENVQTGETLESIDSINSVE